MEFFDRSNGALTVMNDMRRNKNPTIPKAFGSSFNAYDNRDDDSTYQLRIIIPKNEMRYRSRGYRDNDDEADG